MPEDTETPTQTITPDECYQVLLAIKLAVEKTQADIDSIKKGLIGASNG